MEKTRAPEAVTAEIFKWCESSGGRYRAGGRDRNPHPHGYGRRGSPSPDRAGKRRSSTHSVASSVKKQKFQAATNKIGQQMCCVTGCTSVLTKVHAFKEHLPGLFQEDIPCKAQTVALRVTCLKLIAKQLNHRPDLGALVKIINLSDDVKTEDLSEGQLTAARAINSELEEGEPEQWSLKPLSSVGLLGHWRTLISAFSMLSVAKACELRDAFPAPERLDLPEAIDSHFHMDRLSKRTRTPRTDFKAAVERNTPPGGKGVNVVGGVAVFCDPEEYPTEEEIAKLKAQGVVSTIGIHPKGASRVDEGVFKTFWEKTRLPGVVGIGEVGLDYSAPPEEWACQQRVLDMVLSNLPRDKVLVIHNRGMTPTMDMPQLLYHMKGLVDNSQRIHVHCFNGSKEAVDLWIENFPNVMFGYTSMVSRLPPEMKDTVRTMEASRILLETDAPYFKGAAKYSTPGFLVHSAKAVAEIRGEPWEEVLRAANANAKRLYSM